MWIIPTNHELYCHYAQDMVASKEDLNLLESELKHSLTWRSKPSRLRTWLQRWNRVSWLPHLFGRTLKPCQHKRFTVSLTYLLAGIPASRSVSLANEMEETIQDTCGLTSHESSTTWLLELYSLRTSTATYHLALKKLSQTWNSLVTQRRGEYSAREKLALRTLESGSSSWATPTTTDYYPLRSEEGLQKMIHGHRKGRNRPSTLREQVHPHVVQAYQEALLPTPRASEYKDCGPVGSKSQQHMEKKFYLCGVVKDKDMPDGKLNPEFVEWLMGVPTGLTELDSWVTELSQPQQLELGEF